MTSANTVNAIQIRIATVSGNPFWVTTSIKAVNSPIVVSDTRAPKCDRLCLPIAGPAIKPIPM